MPAVAASDYDTGVSIRRIVGNLPLQPAAGRPARAGNVAAGKILAGVHKDDGIGRIVGQLRNAHSRNGVARRGQQTRFAGPAHRAVKARPHTGARLRLPAGAGPGVDAAVQRVHFAIAQLPIPRRHQRSARLAVAAEHNRGIFHHGHIVAALHALPPGKPAEAGNMAGGVLFGRADIDEIDALAAAARGKLVQAGNVQEADAVLGGAAVGISFGGGAAGVGHRGQRVPVGAGFQFVAGQHPAGSAVFQPDDFPIQPHPLQNPRADDAARTAGAVDDHGSIGVQVGGNIGNAERQLAAGHTAPAGDAKAAVFLRRPRVQYHHFVAPFHTGAQFNGVNLRHIMDDFHLFAEIFTGNIHAPLGGMVQAHPAVDAPLQPGDVGVAHCGGSRHRA